MGEGEAEKQQNMEPEVEKAVRSRLPYFKEHADTMSMLKVRRMLEEDLGLEKFALDGYKLFIKQSVEKLLTQGHDYGSENVMEHAVKSPNSTAEVKKFTKDSEKDEHPQEPRSNDDTGRIEEAAVEPKGGSVSVQGTDITESSIKKAILDRVDHFRANINSLSMVASRKLLEEDLGLQRNALDPFKKFIRKEIEKVLTMPAVSVSTSVDSQQDKSGGNRGKATDTSDSKEKPGSRSKSKDTAENMGPCIKDERQGDEDSPRLGLLTSKDDPVNAEGSEIRESAIKKAILDQAHHFRANAETLTLAGSRRFLEGKLGLQANTLDPFKKFISKQIEEILDSPGDDVKEATEEVRDKKSNQQKRRRSTEEETKARKKSKEVAKSKAAKKTESDEYGNSSEGGGSQASSGKVDKRKVATTSGYGKRVEHLKSVIKACGMSVPPSIYKKVKQVSEEKRESYLTKELEEVLSKEGLSTNPSEKEIKEVKRKKEKAKELEGIDLSNIVTSGRRRSVTSFADPWNIRKEDKSGNKTKVGDTKDKKNSKKITDGTKDDDMIKDDDEKVAKASGDDREDEDVTKKEKQEEVEKGEKEVEEIEEEEEEEEEESSESDEFNEDDGDDSD